MTVQVNKATLLWVNHCYGSIKGTISLWLIPGDEEGITDTLAREKGTCLIKAAKDIKSCQDLTRNLDEAFRTLGIALRHEETADD